MELKIMIIFNDEYFPLLLLPYRDEKIFVTNTIHNNTYSGETLSWRSRSFLVIKP